MTINLQIFNFKYLLPESFLQSLLRNEEEIFWFS